MNVHFVFTHMSRIVSQKELEIQTESLGFSGLNGVYSYP